MKIQTSSLLFMTSKSIFIVLLCFLIVDYLFYIYTNIKLFFNLNYNNKKIIVKIKKKNLDVISFSEVFWLFYHVIKIKKYLYVPIIFKNNK